MHVAIVIVGFRNASDIKRCLAAIGSSTYEDFEVVICENGGREAFDVLAAATPARLPGGQSVTVMPAPSNLGFAGGVNFAIGQRPDADAWWVLNPDTEPHPDALAAKVRRLSVGDCDAVGCILVNPTGEIEAYGGIWRSLIARTVALGTGRPADDRVDPGAVERNQNFLMGAAMLVGRRFVETTGLMREDYFLYCEEAEWCLRGIARGMRLGFAPEARVVHHRGTTTGAGEAIHHRPRMPVYLGERNRMLLTRDLFPARLPIAAAAAAGQLFLRYAARGAWRQFGYGMSGLWAGLLNQRGAPEWITA
jgi:N-acetylglucosaminyl-diphospho-decaprenol L-rhamnosyltransferase